MHAHHTLTLALTLALTLSRPHLEDVLAHSGGGGGGQGHDGHVGVVSAELAELAVLGAEVCGGVCVVGGGGMSVSCGLFCVCNQRIVNAPWPHCDTQCASSTTKRASMPCVVKYFVCGGGNSCTIPPRHTQSLQIQTSQRCKSTNSRAPAGR